VLPDCRALLHSFSRTLIAELRADPMQAALISSPPKG
jgi:hypothetical protein